MFDTEFQTRTSLHRAWGGAVVKAQRYLSDGPGIDSRGVTGFFSNIFLPTVPWPWGRLSP